MMDHEQVEFKTIGNYKFARLSDNYICLVRHARPTKEILSHKQLSKYDFLMDDNIDYTPHVVKDTMYGIQGIIPYYLSNFSIPFKKFKVGSFNIEIIHPWAINQSVANVVSSIEKVFNNFCCWNKQSKNYTLKNAYNPNHYDQDNIITYIREFTWEKQDFCCPITLKEMINSLTEYIFNGTAESTNQTVILNQDILEEKHWQKLDFSLINGYAYKSFFKGE